VTWKISSGRKNYGDLPDDGKGIVLKGRPDKKFDDWGVWKNIGTADELFAKAVELLGSAATDIREGMDALKEAGVVRAGLQTLDNAYRGVETARLAIAAVARWRTLRQSI